MKSDQCPFPQKPSGGWRQHEARSLLMVVLQQNCNKWVDESMLQCAVNWTCESLSADEVDHCWKRIHVMISNITPAASIIVRRYHHETCRHTAHSLTVSKPNINSYSAITRDISSTLSTRMWANAQRDGCPAEHRWRPLFNAAKFGWRPLLDAVQ